MFTQASTVKGVLKSMFERCSRFFQQARYVSFRLQGIWGGVPRPRLVPGQREGWQSVGAAVSGTALSNVSRKNLSIGVFIG